MTDDVQVPDGDRDVEAVLHALTCPIRSRWRRRHFHQPFWRDDKTAKMLGVAHLGCRRCGRGAAS